MYHHHAVNAMVQSQSVIILFFHNALLQHMWWTFREIRFFLVIFLAGDSILVTRTGCSMSNAMQYSDTIIYVRRSYIINLVYIEESKMCENDSRYYNEKPVVI